jgi:hypothetical protein
MNVNKLVKTVGLFFYIVTIFCGVIIANGNTITNGGSNSDYVMYSVNSVNKHMGMSDPGAIVKEQRSELSTNIYVVMYVSSGITLASLFLAYRIFDRSQVGIDKISENVLQLTKHSGVIASQIEAMGANIALKPCQLDKIEFWNKMDEMGFKKRNERADRSDRNDRSDRSERSERIDKV